MTLRLERERHGGGACVRARISAVMWCPSRGQRLTASRGRTARGTPQPAVACFFPRARAPRRSVTGRVSGALSAVHSASAIRSDSGADRSPNRGPPESRCRFVVEVDPPVPQPAVARYVLSRHDAADVLAKHRPRRDIAAIGRREPVGFEAEVQTGPAVARRRDLGIHGKDMHEQPLRATLPTAPHRGCSIGGGAPDGDRRRPLADRCVHPRQSTG